MSLAKVPKKYVPLLDVGRNASLPLFVTGTPLFRKYACRQCRHFSWSWLLGERLVCSDLPNLSEEPTIVD